MNPSDLIFSAANDLFGGVVTDLTAALIAMTTFCFILLGVRLLSKALLHKDSDNESSGLFSDLHEETDRDGINNKKTDGLF